MSDKEYIDNLTIWCSYHNDELINVYNLDYIPNYIKLFNTNNLLLSNDNINYLNPHLNEICTMYYVWKNQIYSKYVGFCHYRRFFSDLGKHSIIKCGIHCLVFIRINLKSYCPEFDFKLKKLFEYLCNTNKFNINKLNDYFNNDKLIDLPWKLSYICEWDKFNEACELYFGFLDTLFTNFKDIKNYENTGRIYGWMSELTLGIILSLLYNNKVYDDAYDDYDSVNYTLITKTDNINAASLWIKKNNRLNSQFIIISDKFSNDELTNIHHSDAETFYVIKNKNEIHNNNNIIIELNINEYIKCLDPIEFRKGNYTIEKFNNI
jgi:hypothetical protein